MPVSVAIITLAALALLAPDTSAQSCAPPVINNAATIESVRSHFQQRGRTVVTFVGYSGADYEDKPAMLARAATVLDRLDPGKTIVNIGATIDGIGAVYQLAKQKQFDTTGIVSSQARSTNATIAPCAGTVFFVDDESWGGLVKRSGGTMALSPTSAAIVAVSDQIVAIGGGDVARDEFDAAKRLGKKTEFFPADMNHAIARARAAKNKQPPPTDFRGALGAALAGAGK
jgi:hypothetical protein